MAAPVPGTQAWYKSRATPLPKTNVPKPKTANVPFTGNPMDFVNSQGTPAAAGQGSPGPASFGTADIAKTFAPVMTKAATPGKWNITDINPEMISSDWEPMQAEAAGAQQMSDAEGGFQKALRQAFIDYGGDVSKVGDWSKYIDAPTMEAAKTNKYSAAASALNAYTKALALGRSKLAAKGMLSSGMTGLQTTDILGAREKAEYEAGRAFLGGADTSMQTLGQLRQQIADKIAAARVSAAARLAAAHPPTWMEPTEAEYDYGSGEVGAGGAPPPLVGPITGPPSGNPYNPANQGPWSVGSGVTPSPKPAPKPPPKPQPVPGTPAWYQAHALPIPKKK